MAHAFGQSVRKQGRFPCSRCETDFGSKRNRRRHRKLRHSEDWIMNYPPQNQPSSSGASKADQSRSAQAAERRERAKLEAQQELLNKQVQLEPEMLKKRRNKNKKVAYVEENSTGPVQEDEQEVEFASHEEFLEHHTKMYREKKLCKCGLCTDATAQGVRNLPQSLQVRERSHTYFCQLCGEPFKHQGALRSHYSTRHTTKNLLNEAREYPRPDSWDRLTESGYNALDVGRDRGGVDDAEDGVDDASS